MTLPVYNPRPTRYPGLFKIKLDYWTDVNGRPMWDGSAYQPKHPGRGPICETCWLKDKAVRAIGHGRCPHTPGGTS